MNLRRQFFGNKNKNNLFFYNVKNILSYPIPDSFFRMSLTKELDKIKNYNPEIILKRVNYYNKLFEKTNLNTSKLYIKDFNLKNKEMLSPSTHFFDTYQYIRYFSKDLPLAIKFGDNTDIPDWPSIVKSRPIASNNQNAVLLKLNKLRHFVFIKDKIPFEKKKDMLISRCSVYQPHRIKFFQMYFKHHLCDLGQTSARSIIQKEWLKPYMTINQHLNYKFILCLQGNDVATNLKWVMSSNSLAVMPKPTFETWFMEGTLIPDYHYVEINHDYSDLSAKLQYYISNPDKANMIIENANKYVIQFQDNQVEKLISLQVLKKYFDLIL